MKKQHRRVIGLILLLIALSVLLFLFNASIPGKRVEGCLQDCAEAVERKSDTIRILSLNVLHGHPDFVSLPTRLTMITAEIERLGVDIALLQEVPWHRYLGSGANYLAVRTGMNSAYLRANGNRWLIKFEEGEAILSRFPLTFVEYRVLKPSAGFFENRVVLHAIAQAPTGPIDLYVTHLTDDDAQVNQAQAESLHAYVERTAQHAAVVAGDFNALEDSPQIITLSQQWLDAFRTIHPELPGFTCCIDKLIRKSAKLSKRIDYIFIVPHANEQVEILDAQVVFDKPEQQAAGWLWASDHVGVLVEINRQE